MPIFSLKGASWVTTPRAPVNQKDYEDIGIACRRCSDQRGWFRSIKHAMADGWRQIQRWKWLTEPCCNHRGLCPLCRDHPEERS